MSICHGMPQLRTIPMGVGANAQYLYQLSQAKSKTGLDNYLSNIIIYEKHHVLNQRSTLLKWYTKNASICICNNLLVNTTPLTVADQ